MGAEENDLKNTEALRFRVPHPQPTVCGCLRQRCWAVREQYVTWRFCSHCSGSRQSPLSPTMWFRCPVRHLWWRARQSSTNSFAGSLAPETRRSREVWSSSWAYQQTQTSVANTDSQIQWKRACADSLGTRSVRGLCACCPSLLDLLTSFEIANLHGWMLVCWKSAP